MPWLAAISEKLSRRPNLPPGAAGVTLPVRVTVSSFTMAFLAEICIVTLYLPVGSAPADVPATAGTRLAASNAELVRLAAEAVTRHGRQVATPAEARAALGLAP